MQHGGFVVVGLMSPGMKKEEEEGEGEAIRLKRAANTVQRKRTKHIIPRPI